MPVPQLTPGEAGGGTEWWRKKEPPPPPKPIPAPPPPVAGPWGVPPEAAGPWTLPPEAPAPRPRAPTPAPPPQPVYPQAPAARPAAAPTLVGLMSERVAPQVAERPAYIPTDPSTVLHDLEQTPQYTQSIADLYMQIARQTPWAGMRVHTQQALEQQRAQIWKPIDPLASLDQIREQWTKGRMVQLGDDFLARQEHIHEDEARKALETGNYARAVRQTTLADAARGTVPGVNVLGYGAERLLGGPQAWLERTFGQYFAPSRWVGADYDYTTATPKELEEASTLTHELARLKAERGARPYPGAGRYIAGKEERKWNPQALPIVRELGDVRPYMIARFGDSPRTQLAIAWGERMAWSGPEAMLAAAERIQAGEDPLAVVMGHKVNLANPTERDYEVYLGYMEAAQTRGRDLGAAAQYVQDNGYIPGEAKWAWELAGAVFLDPLDWAFGALNLLGAAPRVRQSLKFWTTKADDALDVTRLSDEAVTAAAKAANAGQTAADARKSNELKRILNMFNPARLMPEAEATRMREPATILATTLAGNVRNADQARAIVVALGTDPSDLARMGLLPDAIANSEAVGNVKPVFAAVLGRMDDLDAFPSLAKRRFNLIEFADDLANNVADVADEIAGVTRDRPDFLFANRVRGTMRDFWMTLNPAYVIRNTAGDIGTIAHDGLFSMHTYGDDLAYLNRVQGQTARTLGIREAGPVAGQVGGLADVPVIGPVVQRFRRLVSRGEIPFVYEKPTIFGEEVRYAKTYAQAHRLADGQWWKAYDLPKEIAEEIGPTNARRLRGALQGALNRAEADLAVAEFVSNRMTRFGVDGFLAEGSELSAAMKADLDVRLAKAVSFEDVTRVLDDARQDVLRHADATIAAGVTPPMRKAVTSIENTQDVSETTLALGAMAKQMGVDDATAVRGAEEVAAAMQDAQRIAIDAEMRAMREAREAGLAESASRAVIMDVRTGIEDNRQVTRATVDRLRNQAWDDYHEMPANGSAIWEKYRQDVSGAWEQLRMQATDSMGWMDGVIGRLGGGEAVTDVLPNYRTTLQDATARYAELYQRLADQDEVLRLTRADSLTDFEKKLQLNRLGEDVAADWAWRMAIENPSVDATDILYSAERDVTELARVARGKADLALVQAKAGELSWDDYAKVVDEAWGEYWDQAPHRWMLASSEVADAQGATKVVTPRAFQEAAKRADVEIGDLSAIGSDGWAKIRDSARRLAEATQNEVMQRTHLRDVRWSSQLEDMIWPVDVEDVAHWAGFDDVTQMGADDWRRVAEMSRSQAHKYELVGSEIGRGARVAQVSGRQAERGVGALAEEMVTAGALSRTEERQLLAQLTQQARQAEQDMVGWLLREAGYTDGDFGMLSTSPQSRLQQAKQLVMELGQGDLLRKAGGAGLELPEGMREGAQVLAEYSLPAGATEGMLAAFRQDADWLLREAGHSQGLLDTMSDPQKQRLLSELAAGGRVEVAVPGRVSQIGGIAAERREKIIEEMPAEVRRLVTEHFPGTAADPLQVVSEQWGRVAERADDWAEMIEHGVPVTEQVPKRFYHGDGWPVLRYDRDETKALLAAVEPLYKQHEEYDQVRRLASQRYDAWSRVDFDEATRPASTNWMAATGEQVVAVDKASAAKGVSHAPRPADLALAAEKAQLSALDSLQGNLESGWDDVLDARQGKFTEAQIAKMREWYRNDFVPLNNARALVTGQTARSMADFALLDYSNRRAFDTWLASIVPYHYWYTRSARNWAIRFAARPGKLGAYYRYKKWIQQGNEARQYPSRLEGMVEIPAEQLPEWTGQRVFIDPMRYYWPFQALMNPYDLEDPMQATNAVDAVYRVGQAFGISPFPHIKAALMLGGVIESDPEELYNLLPQTAPLQAISASARQLGAEQVPPGGIYIEAPLRRALGLTEMEPAGPYRIARAQVSMELDRVAQGDPSRQRFTLMAMELMYAVERNHIRLPEALGIEAGPLEAKTPAAYVGERVRQMADQNGWSDEDLKIAQGMLAEAVQRAAMERGMTALTAQTGMPAYLYPTGEQRARGLQREQLATRYSPLTGLGSRAGYQDYLQAHPESRLRSITFGLLPGEEQGEFGPQQTLNLLQYNAEREQIEQQSDQQIDDYIRRNPWDSASVSALRQSESAALADLRARLMGDEEYDEAKLWSVFGATPEERAKRRNEQMLSIVSGNAPSFEEFTDPQTGEVDYDAWETATATYYETLGMRFMEHPFVAQLAAQAGATDLEAFSREMFAAVTEKDVTGYRRRNDTPLEAAQRTWGELYSMAWEAYNKAVEEDEDKGIAYQTYIEGLPAMQGAALVRAVQKEYPDRWTETELREALAGVQFPSGDEVHVLRKPQAEQEVIRARDEFYQWFSWHVPPGEFEYEMRDAIPLLAAIKDFTTREALQESGFTAQQYQTALEQVQEYMAKQPQPGGDALEYNFARGMNRIFMQFREAKFPGMGDVLAYRAQKWGGLALSKAARAERDAFDAQHPELAAYRTWEAAFAQQHLVWAKYFRPWLVEEEPAKAAAAGVAAPTGEEAAAGARAAAARPTYAGGGAGAPSRIGSWGDFAGLVETETMTALFRLWGNQKALPGAARAALEALHKRWGWGDFEEWLAWLQRLYQDAFAGQARAVPGAKAPKWIPGVWRT